MRRILNKFLYLLFFSPLFLFGQSDVPQNGIKWVSEFSWEQIKEKAKNENKIILIDCYTTWCVPCKKMENEVFVVDSVGHFFNEKFISIRVQMDSTIKDDKLIQAFYADAVSIKTKYKVTAFPTLLFITPMGEIVNRHEGFMNSREFIQLGQDVLNPGKGYQVLLTKHDKNELSLDEMRALCQTALVMGDTLRSVKIAKDFIERLEVKDLFIKENIQFLSNYTNESTHRGFKVFCNYSDSINKLMGESDYSQSIVQGIIFREIVSKTFDKPHTSNFEPDWRTLFSNIKSKHGLYYAERVILFSKYLWARKMKNYRDYTKYIVQFVDKYKYPKFNLIGKLESIEDLILNNYAWAVFQYSYDENELKRAIYWSSMTIMRDPEANWMDTYANLLYKIGQTRQALIWEEMAAKLDPSDQNIQKHLSKMKKGEPTWLDDK
jgi:thioredoxin-related protein